MISTWIKTLAGLSLLFVLFLSDLAFAGSCYGILIASHVPMEKIEVPFVKGLASMSSALQARGCKASDIKIFLGNGQPQQEAIFTNSDLKSKLTSSLISVRSYFPGLQLYPAQKIVIEGAISDLQRLLKPGDIVYLQVTGHAYNKTEFPIADGKINTDELSLWLGRLPKSASLRVIYDVCYSGFLVEQLSDSNTCVFTSTNNNHYSKYSFDNSFSMQMGLALKNPQNSVLQAFLAADRRDHQYNEAHSSLGQLIEEATKGLTLDQLAQKMITEEAQGRTALQQLFSPVIDQQSQFKLINASQKNRNPLQSIKLMLNFPTQALYSQFIHLKKINKINQEQRIQLQDVEMALRLKYVEKKGSVYFKKRLQRIATCMGETL
jgi:hypothetical protein